MSTTSHELGALQSSANAFFFSITISYLSFLRPYGITTTSSSTTTEDHRLSGLSLEEIKDLPCFDCRVNIASICVVCLDDVHRGDRCRRFPSCNHVFHAQCIDPWLVRRLTCPTCRSPFKTNVDLDVYLDAV